jgi:hypothetical protein
LGKAELLVETSFADLRHGGDGNLSRAHGLTKKVRLFANVGNYGTPLSTNTQINVQVLDNVAYLVQIFVVFVH